jgi:hypothetical protein
MRLQSIAPFYMLQTVLRRTADVGPQHGKN